MAEELKNRSQVPVEDSWAVEDIYPSFEEWEEDFQKTGAFAERIGSWSGRLDESPEVLRSGIEELLSQHRLLEKLMVYASMKKDEDLSDSKNSGRASQIMSRMVEVNAAGAFFTPELLAIPEETVDSWLKTEVLGPYRIWLENILRFRPHTLSQKEEVLLANAGEIISGFSNAFGKLSNVDMPARYPEIRDENGEMIKLTNGNYNAFMQRKDRGVREDAFRGLYEEVQGNAATKAALLEGQVKSQIFRARARKFSSAIESSLFNDRVDLKVYDSLIGSVHENLPVLHEYYRLRGDVLGIAPSHMWDVYVPVVEQSKAEYSWEDAVDLTLEAVAPLGEEYVESLRQGFKDRWVDKYENRGKRSGAYSGGFHDSYPYILHNFNGTLQSVFTLAHEAGHSMHSFFSRNSQPYHLSDYRIIVAEVASTTNEMLLIDLLLGRLEDDRERAYLLDHLIGKFRSTLIRQTMFAEFEKLIHQHAESGGSLTPDYLSESYYGLVRQYHGDSFKWDSRDELISTEWSRIPHFYYNFYVYKYATGLSAAVDISRRILAKEPGSVEDYLKFLKGGCSKPPLDLLRGTGVDLATPEPVNSALAYMEEALDQLKGMIDPG